MNGLLKNANELWAHPSTMRKRDSIGWCGFLNGLYVSTSHPTDSTKFRRQTKEVLRSPSDDLLFQKGFDFLHTLLSCFRDLRLFSNLVYILKWNGVQVEVDESHLERYHRHYLTLRSSKPSLTHLFAMNSESGEQKSCPLL